MQTKKPVTAETYVTLGVFALFFGYMTRVMGTGNFFNTLMRTAHDLILQTVLFIMGIAILAGAFAAILSEFGVIDLLNRLITPLFPPSSAASSAREKALPSRTSRIVGVVTGVFAELSPKYFFVERSMMRTETTLPAIAPTIPMEAGRKKELPFP